MSCLGWQVGCIVCACLLTITSVLCGLVLHKLYKWRAAAWRELQSTCSGSNCRSRDMGLEPAFRDPKLFGRELAQLYYYHDLVYTKQFSKLPGAVLVKVSYSSNPASEPPICVVFRTASATFCIFRGTKTKPELKADWRFSQVDVPGIGLAHSGFAAIHAEIEPQIMPALSATVDRLIVFGHSLGGALTNLLAANLSAKHPELWKMSIAFGSAPPRVFSPEAADGVMKATDPNLVQVVNDADIIPTVPWSVMDLGESDADYFKGLTNQRVLINVVGGTLFDCHDTRTYADAVQRASSSTPSTLPG